ncbi:MAG TPA: hypothetical protein VFV89_05685 [Nocardioides sp.]|uniref:hypothetical protein n=1 Tax=Nocardioides sp. TaxID=35761 RepID=UPI002E33A5F7|nr:hypothetical protein [Nocardioides sp.]HEX5087278.1 hypothetical protein [Nocardioides sp.]
MTRGLKALAAVAVVVVVVVLGARALSTSDDDPAGSSPPGSRGTAPPRPGGAPAEGMYVVSDVGSDGQVAVETWVRAPHPISELEVTTTDPDLRPGSVESLDLDVRTMDGALVAHRESVGTDHQTIRLQEPASELYFSYTVDGALDSATSTVPGRSLVRVLAMDVDYEDAATGVVRRLVTASGTVLNLACLRPGSGLEASPRPCGRAVGDGDWTVDLSGPDIGDRLLAQVED